MAGCGDVLSLEDLQTAKKHQIFEAEVITGKVGGVAGGATIDTATNPVTGQTQQTLPSILADLGFDVQSWTSSTGGVLASANQVFLNDTPGSLGLGDYYAWGGAFPKTVPAGTDPALPTSGYIMRSSRFAGVQAREALRRSYAEAGYNLVDGSFETGGTLVNANDVLLQERTGKAFFGPAGTVAAGTNPTSGGFTTIEIVLSTVPNYAGLRAYAGQAKSIYVTGVVGVAKPEGISGYFALDASDATSADNGGTIIVDALGRRWKRVFKGEVNVLWFGAAHNTDSTVAIQKAVDSMTNSYAVGKSLYFPDGSYILTAPIIINLTRGGGMLWRGAQSSSIFTHSMPDNTYCIDIDYSVGATANYITFAMENMTIIDHLPPTSPALPNKHGIRMKRNTKGRFVKCNFLNLNKAIDSFGDTHWNHFDTCEFRGNVNSWSSSDGNSNNHVFTNCLWSYHYGTAFDGSNSAEHTFIGGDFEPGNAAPAAIFNKTTVVGTRFERNKTDVEGIRVLDGCTISAFPHSDGGTQYNPFARVTGSGNTIDLHNFSGASAVLLDTTSRHNKVNMLGGYTCLLNITLSQIISDLGSLNTVNTAGSMQGAERILEANTVDLLGLGDLTTWTPTNCTVTFNPTTKVYSVTSTSASAHNLSKTVTGTFDEITLAMSAKKINNAGGAYVTVAGKTTNGQITAVVGKAQRSYLAKFNYTRSPVTNPVITITFAAAGVGASCDFWDVRSTNEACVPD